MIEWRAYKVCDAWFVDEYDEHGFVQRIAECDSDEGLARRIVRTCNALDDLLEGCKSALDSLLDGGAALDEEAVMLSEAAIARAEGKEATP